MRPHDQLGDRVHEARAAHADRVGVADHLERELLARDLDALDRALGRAHAAADLGGLEGRAGRAAVDTTRSCEPSAISEFVPTSMKRRTRRSRVRPVASMPATMSPPT